MTPSASPADARRPLLCVDGREYQLVVVPPVLQGPLSSSSSSSSSSLSSSQHLHQDLPMEDALFPLPEVAYFEVEDAPHAARRGGHVRTRRRQQRYLVGLINRAVRARNRLWAGDAGSARQAPVRRHAVSQCAKVAITGLIRDCSRLSRHLRRACREVANDGAGLQDLCLSYHEVRKKKDWVLLRSDTVALPAAGEGAQVPFIDHVLPEFTTEAGGTLAPVAPTAAEVAAIPVVVGVETGQYGPVMLKTAEAGIVTFQDEEPKVVNGLFGVFKTDKQVRLIIDLRRGNLYFRGSEDLELLNPTYLVEVILEGEKMFVGKTDISNFFHRVQVPAWMSQYFGLPRVLSDEVGLAGPQRWVFPVVRSLPMGFIRSVEIAQALHDRLVLPALPARCVSLTAKGPKRLTADQDLHTGYIDDDGAASVQVRPCAEVLTAVKGALGPAGLPHKPSKDVIPGAQEVAELMGIDVHEKGFLLPGAEKLVRVMNASAYVCSSKRCSSEVMGRIVGLWVWFLLLNRCLLSVLDKVYDFIAADLPIRAVPKEVRRELRMLIDLAPDLVVDLRRLPGTVAVATDASPHGQGVCYAQLPKGAYDPMAVHALRRGWRTQHDGRSVDTALPDELPHDSRFPPVLHDFVRTSDWRTSVSQRWKHRGEHITLGEGRAVLSGIRWLARQPRHHGTRVPFFIDSQACLGALAKGRSSSRKLNRICRRVAAYVCAARLKVSWLWVPTDHNPADAPSRHFRRPLMSS